MRKGEEESVEECEGDACTEGRSSRRGCESGEELSNEATREVEEKLWGEEQDEGSFLQLSITDSDDGSSQMLELGTEEPAETETLSHTTTTTVAAVAAATAATTTVSADNSHRNTHAPSVVTSSECVRRASDAQPEESEEAARASASSGHADSGAVFDNTLYLDRTVPTCAHAFTLTDTDISPLPSDRPLFHSQKA